MKIIDGKLIWDLPCLQTRIQPVGKLKRISFPGSIPKFYIDKQFNVFKVFFDSVSKKSVAQFHSQTFPL